MSNQIEEDDVIDDTESTIDKNRNEMPDDALIAAALCIYLARKDEIKKNLDLQQQTLIYLAKFSERLYAATRNESDMNNKYINFNVSFNNATLDDVYYKYNDMLEKIQTELLEHVTTQERITILKNNKSILNNFLKELVATIDGFQKDEYKLSDDLENILYIFLELLGEQQGLTINPVRAKSATTNEKQYSANTSPRKIKNKP